MKLGELLRKQFTKAGMDLTAPEIIAAMALDTEIPDAMATQLDSSLLTVEAAKSNSEVNKFLRKKHLDAADKRMEALITELGLELGDDFKNEESTYEKIEKLTRAATAAGKKASAGTGEDAKEWAKKELKYNTELAALKASLAQKDTDFATQNSAREITYGIEKFILAKIKELDLPEGLDVDIKIDTARKAIEKDLANNGFKLQKNEAGQLAILNKEGLPAYDSANVAISKPDDYFTGVLTHSKLLKINSDPGNKTPGSPIIPNKDKNASNETIVNEISAQMGELGLQ